MSDENGKLCNFDSYLKERIKTESNNARTKMKNVKSEQNCHPNVGIKTLAIAPNTSVLQARARLRLSKYKERSNIIMLGFIWEQSHPITALYHEITSTCYHCLIFKILIPTNEHYTAKKLTYVMSENVSRGNNFFIFETLPYFTQESYSDMFLKFNHF